MLRTHCSAHNVFKAFSSTFSLEYTAVAAPNIGTPVVTNNYDGTNHVARVSKSASPVASLTVQDKLRRLENNHINSGTKVLQTKSQVVEGPSNILLEYLKIGQNTRFLIEILIQNHLNSNHITGLFANGQLTEAIYSTFINKILLERNLDAKLSNVIPDTPHTEILLQLFEIYCKYVIAETQDKLTPLQLFDLNLFVKKFIDEAQLGKAQKCLQYILNKQRIEYILETGDTNTIINFLRLRCGALPKYWKMNQKGSSKSKRLGEDSSRTLLTKSYKFQDENSLLYIINTVLKDKIWNKRHSDILDASIVYSLGYLGQIDLIDQYIKSKWGVPQTGSVIMNTEILPKPELLVAIVSSYCMQNGDMPKGLQVLDQFMKKFPNIELDQLFWRRLLQLSSRVWDKSKDKKRQISHGCWSIMKQWHKQKGLNLPFDQGILQELYEVFKMTKNGSGALDVLVECFPALYLKPEFEISKSEMRLLNQYQKLVLKVMASKGNYHKAFEFIKQWSVNKINKQQMHEHFMKHREKYDLRQERERKKKEMVQTNYDAMEEEDMLLGRLW